MQVVDDIGENRQEEQHTDRAESPRVPQKFLQQLWWWKPPFGFVCLRSPLWKVVKAFLGWISL